MRTGIMCDAWPREELKKTVETPRDKMEAYDELIAPVPGIERKGASMPYTSLEWVHVQQSLDKKESMGRRLPKEGREPSLEKHDTSLQKQHGPIMKAYVTVPYEPLKIRNEMDVVLEIRFADIENFKPKPTRKKS